MAMMRDGFTRSMGLMAVVATPRRERQVGGVNLRLAQVDDGAGVPRPISAAI